MLIPKILLVEALIQFIFLRHTLLLNNLIFNIITVNSLLRLCYCFDPITIDLEHDLNPEHLRIEVYTFKDIRFHIAVPRIDYFIQSVIQGDNVLFIKNLNSCDKLIIYDNTRIAINPPDQQGSGMESIKFFVYLRITDRLESDKLFKYFLFDGLWFLDRISPTFSDPYTYLIHADNALNQNPAINPQNQAQNPADNVNPILDEEMIDFEDELEEDQDDFEDDVDEEDIDEESSDGEDQPPDHHINNNGMGGNLPNGDVNGDGINGINGHHDANGVNGHQGVNGANDHHVNGLGENNQNDEPNGVIGNGINGINGHHEVNGINGLQDENEINGFDEDDEEDGLEDDDAL